MPRIPWSYQTLEQRIKTVKERHERSRRNFRRYRPIVNVLKKSSCPQSPKDIRRYTGRTLRTEEKYLDELWQAGLVGRTGVNEYYLDDSHREGLRQTFGVTV